MEAARRTENGPKDEPPPQSGDGGQPVVDQVEPPLPRLRFSPLVWLSVAIALTLLAVAIMVSATRSHDVVVLVAERSLRANQVLSEADVRAETRRDAGEHDVAALPIVGRILTRAVAEGSVLARRDIGPALDGLGTAPQIIGLPSTRATILGNSLESGDRITLLVGRPGAKTARVAAVVLSTSTDRLTGPHPWALVVAVDSRDALAYGYRLGRSGAVVVRSTGSPRG